MLFRSEKLKNLAQESNRFWDHIVSECYDFEQGKFTLYHPACFIIWTLLANLEP